MIWGFSDVPMTPKTNYFYLWRHQDTTRTPQIIREKPKSFHEYDVRKSQNLEIGDFETIRKDGRRHIMASRAIKS